MKILSMIITMDIAHKEIIEGRVTTIIGIEEVSDIECADGLMFAYDGYIGAKLDIPGISVDLLDNCLLLVVPDSNYNSQVSLLLAQML